VYSKAVIRAAVELVARSNVFGLTNAIARERGIAAYRAWLPLERIRPAHIAQEKWEERFAWPADGKPPYPPLTHRVVRAVLTYLAVVVTSRPAAGVHAFPRADLAGQGGKNVGGGWLSRGRSISLGALHALRLERQLPDRSHLHDADLPISLNNSMC
jgi:hypothetical protein